MADLNKYTVPQHNAGDPYHWEYDNLPINALAARDEVINGELENLTSTIRNANGTQGTIANRLNQSIEENGDLKTSAIDEAIHNIAEHTDGTKTEDSEVIDVISDLGYNVTNPVSYVRMLEVERNKLSLIADSATKLILSVEGISNINTFDDGEVVLSDSPSVAWEVSAGNKIKANLAFPTAAAHRHYYDIEPLTENNQDYDVTSVNTAYVEGSLRVYINGVRLSSTSSVYVPSHDLSETWTANSFTENPEAGTFELLTAIDTLDVIRIDFDVSYI